MFDMQRPRHGSSRETAVVAAYYVIAFLALMIFLIFDQVFFSEADAPAPSPLPPWWK
jgi:hypothetical protein